MTATNEAQLFNDFVLRGFFSEYLPPCFNLKMADSKILFDLKISCDFDYVPPYRYMMSRFTEDGSRRKIYIPEFCSYLKTIRFFKDENILKELIEVSTSGTNSFSPIIQPDGTLTRHDLTYTNIDERPIHDSEVINQSTYIPNIVDKIKRSKGAVGILRLDISDFYNNIKNLSVNSDILSPWRRNQEVSNESAIMGSVG